MTTTNGKPTYNFTALTDIWTGDADGKSNRLITTGLLGSIRWWFEVLVRGLGGSACDPSNTECKDRNHCVVCELFGCTGWARKFRFDVLDENDNIKKCQIKRNHSFSLRFIPLRPIQLEEWALLEATLRLIADFGALGGKTSLLASNNKKSQYADYGIIESTDNGLYQNQVTLDDVKSYVGSKWRNKFDQNNFLWASLDNFWSITNKQLSRNDIKKIISSMKNDANGNDNIKQWLLGKPGQSKKVFSFKNPEKTFGFVKPGLIGFNDMKQRLKEIWNKNDWDFLTGDTIIDQLLAGKGSHS